MKNKKIVLVVLALAAFCITGCAAITKALSTPVQFSFAENESSATITFVSPDKKGVRLVDCEGVERPAPEQGTYWETAVGFPAGEALNIRVYVYWNEDQFGERRRGIFKCPPLEAGRDYKLWFKGNLKGGTLTLTYADVNFLNSKTEIVYEQKIPPVPK